VHIENGEDYNKFRPHSSLNDLTPHEVHEQMKKEPDFSILAYDG